MPLQQCHLAQYQASGQIKSVPFRASVVVETLNGGCGLLEADVVETGKGSATDVFDCVVWDEKLLLHSRGGEFLRIQIILLCKGCTRNVTVPITVIHSAFAQCTPLHEAEHYYSLLFAVTNHNHCGMLYAHTKTRQVYRRGNHVVNLKWRKTPACSMTHQILMTHIHQDQFSHKKVRICFWQKNRSITMINYLTR